MTSLSDLVDSGRDDSDAKNVGQRISAPEWESAPPGPKTSIGSTTAISCPTTVSDPRDEARPDSVVLTHSTTRSPRRASPPPRRGDVACRSEEDYGFQGDGAHDCAIPPSRWMPKKIMKQIPGDLKINRRETDVATLFFT